MDALERSIAQYLQQVELPRLTLPPGDILLNPSTQHTIYTRMFDTTQDLPPAHYRARVLKQLLSLIEASITDPEEDEIIDPLMNAVGELVAIPKPSDVQQAQQLSYITYTDPGAAGQAVVTSESRGLILSSGTTGFRTWEAALHLGTYLSTPEGRGFVRGKRMIELGAGTGFLSLFCARYLGVKSVVVTDREPGLIENIKNCVRRNQLSEDIIRPAIWDWGTPLDDSHSQTQGFDIALGADLIYDPDIIPLLISTLQDLFNNYSLKEFLISATIRNEETFQTFLDACESSQFTVQKLPWESPAEDSQTGFFHSTVVPIRTFRVTR